MDISTSLKPIDISGLINLLSSDDKKPEPISKTNNYQPQQIETNNNMNNNSLGASKLIPIVSTVKPIDVSSFFENRNRNLQQDVKPMKVSTNPLLKESKPPLQFNFNSNIDEKLKEILQNLEVPDEKVQNENLVQTKPEVFPLEQQRISTTLEFTKEKYGCLQEIIDKAPEQSLVLIPEGVYDEYLIISKRIMLQPKNSGRVQILGIKSNSPYLLISNFDCKSDQVNGGLLIENGYVKISDCSFVTSRTSAISVINKSKLEAYKSTLSAANHPCLFTSKSSFAYLNCCHIKDSSFLGILAIDSSCLELIGTEVLNNLQGGLLIASYASISITNSKFIGNKCKCIECISLGNINITNTLFDGGQPSILAAGCTIVNITGCSFSNCQSYAIFAQNAASIISNECTYKDSGKFVMIATTSTGSFSSKNDRLIGEMHAGIASIDGGQAFIENLIAEGTTGTALFSAGESSLLCCSNSVLKGIKDISVQAGESSRMELENIEISESQNVGLVLQEGARCKIEKVRIRNCKDAACNITNITNATFSQCEFVENSPAGVIFDKAAEVTFDNCLFKSNSSIGVAVSGENVKPTFINCIFEENGDLGLNVLEGSTVTIKSSSIRNNKKGGMNIDSSIGNLTEVEFNENNGTGLSVFRAGQATIEKCLFTKNAIVGCQVYHKSSIVKINNSTFKEHHRSCSILATEEGAAICTECVFESSKSSHVDARKGAAIALTKCDLSKSLSGISCQVHDGGFLHIIQTIIHDEKRYGIIVARNGYLEFMSSRLYNVNEIGISADKSSTTIIQSSVLSGNGDIGLQVVGGNLTLSNTLFQNFKDVAFISSKSDKMFISDLKYENNSKDFVEVEE